MGKEEIENFSLRVFIFFLKRISNIVTKQQIDLT